LSSLKNLEYISFGIKEIIWIWNFWSTNKDLKLVSMVYWSVENEQIIH
jgi:hypothetical protein